MVYINIIYIVLNCKCIIYIGEAYINCFAGSLNISAGKTLVFSSGVLFAYLSISGKLYYSSGLSLNININLTSIGF